MSMHDDPASLGFATLVAAEPGADSLERFALIAHGLGLPVLRVQASNTHINLRDAQAFPRFPPPMIRGLVLVDISSLDDDSRASQLWHRYLDETNTRGSGDDYTRVVFVDQSGRDPRRHSAHLVNRCAHLFGGFSEKDVALALDPAPPARPRAGM
jgi:hypothetical protein